MPVFGLLLIHMQSGHTPDFLPPRALTVPLWKRLWINIHDVISPEQLPPLHLTSRPIDIGMNVGDRIGIPWFRTVFTNLGDVISPEILPPLELQSQPEDVGELLGDQLQRPWWSSLIRSLADRVAPERLPALALTSKPADPAMASSYLIAPQWSAMLDVPKLFDPDKPKESRSIPAFRPILTPAPPPKPIDANRRQQLEVLMLQKKRALRYAHIREGLWVSCVAAEVVFLVFFLFHS